MKSLIVTISCLLIAFPAVAQGGPCLGISDYDSNPAYELTINPFPRNQLPSYSFGGYNSGQIRTRQANSTVNLRSQANTNANNVLTAIPNKTRIRLYGGYYSQDNYWWWFTEYNNKLGWIRADYICGDPQ